MLNNIARKFFGTPNDRYLKKINLCNITFCYINLLNYCIDLHLFTPNKKADVDHVL